MRQTRGDPDVYFPDFIELIGGHSELEWRLEDNCGDWCADLRICADGIFLATVPILALLSEEEIDALPQHPTGKYEEPILPFPAKLSAVERLLEEHGPADCIDHDRRSAWIARKSHDQSSGRPTSRLDQLRSRLREIIEALERYAEETGQPFDRLRMPGPLGKGFTDAGSFHWLCAKVDSRFKKAKTTFEKHRAGICAVGKYAPSSDFYREALPHIEPKFIAQACQKGTRKTP